MSKHSLTSSDRNPAPTTAAAAVTEDRSDTGLLRASGSQVIPTLISRITGFLKAVALAATIGLGSAGSSFSVANTLPNIVAELVLGAVLTSIVVPVLVRAEREDADGGREFTRRLLTVAGLVLLVATVVSMVGAPWLIHLFLDPNGQVDTRLATLFALLLLPQILFYGLGALFGAILNTRNLFARVAWAPVLNNVVTLAAIVAYYLTPGELQNSLTNPKLLVLGVGTTLGIVTQAVYLVPALRRLGVDLRPKWGIDARLKHFGGMGVAVLAYVLVSQVGFIITNRVASQYDASGPVLFQNAWLLLQVPYGVLGVSLITAIMPRMSRSAAADDTRAVVADLSLASRLSIVGLLPIVALFTVHGSTLGLALFSLRGDASAIDNAGRLGTTVAVSAFGLLPFAVGLIQLRVFYARQQPWIPTLLMALTVIVRIPFLLWIPPFVHADQVVGWVSFINGVGFAAGALAGGLVLWRQLGHVDTRALARTSATVLTASLIAVAVDALVVLLLPLHTLTDTLGTLPGAVVAMTVHSIIVLGIGYGLLLVFKLPETAGMVAAITARLPQRLYPRRAAPAAAAGEPDLDPSMFAETTLLPRLPGAALPYPYPSNHEFGRGRAVPVGDSSVERPGSGPARHHAVVRGPRLMPGAAVAGGRYRLLASHGGSGLLRFWQATDTVLERDVALTFVDADQTADPDDAHGPQEVLARTMRLGRIDSPGLARVLDVVRGSSGGIVVAEWTTGRSLADVAATRPPALGAARAVRALAAVAETAHRSGTALGLDHPDRVRISSAGHAVLAFPGVPVAAEPATDVQGLGAVLYALITHSWPLTAPAGSATENSVPGHIGGLPLAQHDDDGAVTPARELRAGVPYEISAVIARALQPQSGIHTAATVQTVLEQVSVQDRRTELLPAVDDPAGPESPLDYDPPTSEPGAAAARRGSGNPARSRGVLLTLIGLGLVAVVIVAFLVNHLVGSLGATNTPLPSLSGPGTSSTPTANAAPSASTAPTQPGGSAVVPVKASVYSPQGTLDDPRNAGKAIDGDPATYWATDDYTQQLPRLKNGLGLLLTLPSSVALSSVAIDSPSAGTVVEIRSAPDATPDLSDTTVLATTTLQSGRTTVALNDMKPTRYLLVWITKLAGTGPYSSKIAELSLQRAG